jgi:hypothetical protein
MLDLSHIFAPEVMTEMFFFLLFFSKRTADLLITINNSIKNTKNNGNHKSVFRQHSKDYEHSEQVAGALPFLPHHCREGCNSQCIDWVHMVLHI